MLLEDLMTRSPATVAPDATVAAAAEIMRDRDVGSLVVLDNTGVVGIITDRDIALRLASSPDLATLIVEDVMTEAPVCLTVGHDVELGLKKMRDANARRMPVLDDQDRLVGVVSLDDIVIHMASELGVAADIIRAEVTTGVAIDG